MRRELTVMPWLAPQLPIAVSVPTLVSDDPMVVRHALIIGDECSGRRASHGSAIGAFLRALHDVDPVGAVSAGAVTADVSYRALTAELEQFRTDVVPLLPETIRGSATALLERMAAPWDEPRLIHADLGPEHIRVVGDQIGGVIDWLDMRVGDTALDLSWVLYGSEQRFSDAVRAEYRPTDASSARACDWHRLGPWHEVTYGLGTDQPQFVHSGLQGVVQRLSRTYEI